MENINEILNEWSYRVHDGIVDMNDPIKVAVLNEILEEYGIEPLDEMRSPTKKAIEKLLNDPRSKGILEPHSRIKRVKNIGNISNEDFINLISNVFDISLNDITLLKPHEKNNPSGKNYAFEFPYEESKVVIVLGSSKAAGIHIEEYELEQINSFIQQNGGKIDILLKDKVYTNITKAEKIKGNKQADFIFYGDEDLYIQHKEINSQQYSGIFDISNNPKIKDFVETIRNISGGVLKSKENYKRAIVDKKSPTTDNVLALDVCYGRGDTFGENKVQAIFFGNIKFEPKESVFKMISNTYFVHPEIPSGGFEPYIYVTYRTGMNQQNIKNARFGIYPEKYYRAAINLEP